MGGRARLGRAAPEEQLTQGVQGCEYGARSCGEGVGFLPRQFRRRKGVSKVLGLRGGWEREVGSSVVLRLVLQSDSAVDEVCSV